MRLNRRTKWERWIAGAAVTICAALMLTGLRGRAQNRGSSAMPRYILLEHEAIVAQPPQLVSEGIVDLAVWSPDGRNVIVLRTGMPDARPDPQNADAQPVEASVVVWNLATRRGLTVWKHRGLLQPEDGFVPYYLSWLPGTQTLLLPLEWRERNLQTDAQGAQQPVETSHHALMFIDVARNQAREVRTQAGFMPYAVSPTRPQIALHDFDNHTARVLDSSGVFGPVLPLPKSENVSVEWMPDGSGLLLRWHEKPTGEKAGTPAAGAAGNKLIQRLARMDAATGGLTPLDKLPARIGNKPKADEVYNGPLRVRQTTQLLNEGASRHRAHPLWLETDTKSDSARTLLCADGAKAQISPRGDAVLYLSQNVAWVAPLTRLPREAFIQSLRALAMRNAKQAATAVMMYSQDYDEMLPSSGDVVSPYLKDDAILDGLNYTYNGGAMKDIENPSQTVLGTYPGPGGTVTIYADGHVKWNNKP